MLINQNLALNQEITFITDGGDTVRKLPYYLSPQSEHILDWFHITMRFTILKQLSQKKPPKESPKIGKELDRAKWYLCHGKVYRSLEVLEEIRFCVEPSDEKSKESRLYKIWKKVDELHQNIEINAPFIPNYGEQYRHGERISSSFAQSTVNELITKRMVKKQQMRWTKKGAHLLLQLRVKNLNNEIKTAFERWYPGMKS